MKKYCIFTANYLPNLGGVERYTMNLARTLIEKGEKVTVVTSNIYGLEQKEIIDDVEIFRMPCFNVLNGRFPVLRYSKEFRYLDRELQKREFDFFIIQTRFYIHSAYGAMFAKKRNIPCIVIEHGTNHFTVNNMFWDFAGHIYEHICKYRRPRATCTAKQSHRAAQIEPPSRKPEPLQRIGAPQHRNPAGSFPPP